jgi:hypothetical protein
MPECVHVFVQWLHEWQDFFGGLIGAGGAVWAVYLTLGKQWKAETENVTSAVATEVTAFAKYVIGAVEICIDICKQVRAVPQTNATYIVRKLFAPPTVYNAVADRIGLLPHPDATTQFYMRLEEVKAATSAIEMAVKFQWAPGQGPPPLISRAIVLPIADMLITALELARPIIADAKSGPWLERRIREITVNQIDDLQGSGEGSLPRRAAVHRRTGDAPGWNGCLTRRRRPTDSRQEFFSQPS